MSGVFQLVGGAADPIAAKLSTTNATVIAEATEGNARVMVPWLRCAAVDNSGPTLAVDILKPDSTVVIIRSAEALPTSGGRSVLYEEGWVLLPGWKLRVTAGGADKIDVTGLALLGDGNA
jgi:hypothetical protein